MVKAKWIFALLAVAIMAGLLTWATLWAEEDPFNNPKVNQTLKQQPE
jgi:hypothetical protein